MEHPEILRKNPSSSRFLGAIIRQIPRDQGKKLFKQLRKWYREMLVCSNCNFLLQDIVINEYMEEIFFLQDIILKDFRKIVFSQQARYALPFPSPTLPSILTHYFFYLSPSFPFPFLTLLSSLNHYLWETFNKKPSLN